MSIDRQRSEISEIVNSIRTLQQVGYRQSAEFVRKYRITGPQLGALRIISLKPGLSLRELSERLYLHVSTVSGIVTHLEERGYASRERSREDRRVIELRVTAAGRRVIARTPLAGMGLLIHKVDELPVGQRRAILKGLRLLLNMMRLTGGRRGKA